MKISIILILITMFIFSIIVTTINRKLNQTKHNLTWEENQEKLFREQMKEANDEVNRNERNRK